MPTAPGGGASSSGAAAGSSGAVASGVADRGRGTVRLDPRRRNDDETRTPAPTVTGTPPTVTPTRTPRPAEAEIEGKITGITAPNFTVMTRSGPVTVQTGPNTIFRNEGNIAGFGDLKIGQEVEVEGVRQGDGSILASKVQIEEDENEQEERTKTPTATPTVTPTPGGPTATPTATRTPGSPTPTKTPEPEDEQDNEVEGTIAGISGSSFTVMTGSGLVTVQTNPSTQFRRDDKTLTFADLKTGMRVEVKGQVQPDKSILASQVSVED
ncbi:MAG TPA: DUF5666 domain-containing protein [Thermoanaerobaculia bacterium]|nr:DUF5666 domain-containing protein [Thermoanaerobaculia bacterium]